MSENKIDDAKLDGISGGSPTVQRRPPAPPTPGGQAQPEAEGDGSGSQNVTG